MATLAMAEKGLRGLKGLRGTVPLSSLRLLLMSRVFLTIILKDTYH